MKSPLKDKHNFKSSRYLKELIPPKSVVETYCLYSGEIELDLAICDRLVVAHTNNYPIYEFWHAMKHDSQRVMRIAQSTYPHIDDALFYRLQEEWWSFNDPYYRAALFLILNRDSSLAMASCGGRHREGISNAVMACLKKFEGNNFYVVLDRHDDLTDNLNTQVKSDVKLFLPGTYSFNLLGAKQERAHDFSPINHDKLSRALVEIEQKWIIVYKYKNAAAKRYKNYNITMIDEYGNQTQKPERCEDLVIANH